MTALPVSKLDRRPTPAAREGLLDWLEEPRAGNGLRFAEDSDGWSFWDYPRLAAAVAFQASRIEALSSGPGGVVSIAAGSGPAFVVAFIGALAAGSTPSPLTPPAFGSEPRAYVEQAAAILRVAAPTLVLADETLLDAIAEAASLAGLPDRPQPLEIGESNRPRERARPAELALLQFTSGSSGRPRGVRVRWSNLEANIGMIRGWLGMGPDDSTASWLPLHHDMGLIGCLLTPIVNQSDVWVLRPEQFVARPLRWIECFGRRGATLTASPSFGFAYAARKLTPDALAGMDFSAWRAAIVGAERVDPATLARFAARLRPYGFDPSAFLPAYGLAEATLAVTGRRAGSAPRAIRPDWSATRPGERLPVVEEAQLADRERVGTGEGWLVGCGRPHRGVRVAIEGDGGRELPDEHFGEIVVEGQSVAAGYEQDAVGESTRFEAGRLRTGDAGVLLGGELFVVGRLGDAVSVRGQMVFAEDLEARIVAIEGVRAGRCAVLAGSDASGGRIVALVEAEPGPWVEEVVAILRARVGPGASVEVIAGPQGTIERTSSGKPRRRVMWRALHDGGLGGERAWPCGAGGGASPPPP
jgi:acyl-CoA synthetase (AMP-forming)/AMP-acid ligase II